MNAKTLAVLLAVMGAVSVLYNQTQTETTLTEFQSWKNKYNVKFESMFEEAYRERIFMENLAKINLHNANEHKSYEMGINQFTGLTQEEFVEQYLGTIVPTQTQAVESDEVVALGDVDWTTQGAVTGVKNQGSCGSCWAFSTTGALEGLSKIAYGSLQSFSEQQLVDCSGSYGNMACNGGLMDNAFKYVRDKGIVHEDEYPYKGVKQACSKDGGAFKVSGYTDVNNCNTLTTALTGRPVSVAVDATNWSAYKSGVFNNCATKLNHGVLLVGSTAQYWRVKNSWAASWGENGYIRLAPGNTCGLCNQASYPNK
jgi:C1A family cysteine protease